MKTKKMPLGLVVMAVLVLLLSIAVVRSPSGSQMMAQWCQIEPTQCVVPQNLAAFPMSPW